MPIGDRYDAYGSMVGLSVLLGVGLGMNGGAAAWVSSLAFAAGSMNVASALLRRQARKAGKPVTTPALSAADLRRRAPIVLGFIVLIVISAAVLHHVFGRSGRPVASTVCSAS